MTFNKDKYNFMHEKNAEWTGKYKTRQTMVK